MDEQLSILVVDDDALDRMAVGRALRASGLAVKVVEAVDSSAALAALAAQSFDSIFLDYRLPGTDGLEVLRLLRAAGITVPVIMLTGQGDEEIAVEIMKSGASDYLPKGKLSASLLASSLLQALRVHRAESERLRTEGRLRFLADMSRMLAASLDYHANLRNLAEFVVPRLADLCAIDVTEPDGDIQRLAWAAGTLAVSNLGGALGQSGARDPDAFYGPAYVIRSGQTAYYSEVNAEQPDVIPAEERAIIVEAGLNSLICVPLIVRERSLGAISLARLAGQRPYDASDVAFAEEIARRTALAVDNALLYHEAQDAIRTRDAFLSVAAHELNTPLTALLGYAEMLQKRMDREVIPGERDQRMARVVVEQARRLSRLIASMLDLSRLQIGQIRVELMSLDLVGLVSRIIEEIRPTLTAHTLLLEVNVEQLSLMGDELRLEQVVQNLIQNAIKYSPEGGAIEVSVQRQGEWALLSVRDHGLGIPRESLSRIFWRFYRATTTRHYHLGGMGVGLYVVKQIVELHEGRVEAESTEGVGSTFRVWLPLE